MKTMVIYDSVFGNTEKIARAIGKALGSPAETGIFRVTDIKPEKITGIKILIVGSPTRAFSPTPAIKSFLKRIPASSLQGVKVAGFDTRINPADVKSAVLDKLIKWFGYAAKPIADKLQKKGGQLAGQPEGFFVKGTEGPLKEGELERAADWARRIINTV